MDSKQLQPLAPHPAGYGKQPDAKLSKRENISLACTACKTRKSKCDGVKPCESCTKKRTECVYDETTDKRRRVIMKRKIDSLEEDRELLLQLVGKLRESSNSRVIQLLNLIRSNAPLHEIKDYLDKKMHKELEKTPELMDVVHSMQESDAQARRRILDVRRLSDDPLWKVPATPWTKISADDDFVSHLVSLWFTWFHPYFNYMDRDRFIKDMQSGDPENSLYCSPFLVNAILADACAYSDYPEAFANLGDLSSKGLHFYEEAKRLYEKEEGRVSLTTIQGLAILFSCACLIGKDRRGWLYQAQLAFVANELIEQHDLGKKTEYAPGVVDTAVWGLYNITAASSLVYHKRPLIRAPKKQYAMPPSSQTPSSDLWIPYPSLVGGVPAHTTHMLKTLADLNQATFESPSWLFKTHNTLQNMSFPEVREAAAEIHACLKEWEANLDDCMRVENSKTPQVLSLHMYYHNIIMNIFGFMEKKAYEEGLKSDAYQSARALRFSSAREVGRLAEIHRASWGNDRVPCGNIQWITIAECTLLEGLDIPENRKAFVDLCISSKAYARRWQLGKAMLRALQLAANELKVTLPSEADALFSDFERTWTSKDTEDISSLLPNFAISLRSDKNDEVELDKFLGKWDALQIAK